MDRLAAKDLTIEEKGMMGVLKVLNAEQTASKFKQAASKGKSRQEQAAANKEIGIESRKASPVKGTKGSSKGGQIKKKEREVMALTKGMVDGKEESQE